MKLLNDWFVFNILVIKGEYLNLMWAYVMYFLIGELFIYTIEKLLKVPNVVMWYDLVWLLFIMIMFGLNSYKLFLTIIKD